MGGAYLCTHSCTSTDEWHCGLAVGRKGARIPLVLELLTTLNRRSITHFFPDRLKEKGDDNYEGVLTGRVHVFDFTNLC